MQKYWHSKQLTNLLMIRQVVSVRILMITLAGQENCNYFFVHQQVSSFWKINSQIHFLIFLALIHSLCLFMMAVNVGVMWRANNNNITINNNKFRGIIPSWTIHLVWTYCFNDYVVIVLSQIFHIYNWKNNRHLIINASLIFLCPSHMVFSVCPCIPCRFVHASCFSI